MIQQTDDYLIKTIRADAFDFFREFVLQCTLSPLQQQKSALRKRAKKPYTVTGEGVYERASKSPQYTPEQKSSFSKATSTSFVTPTIHVPPFGHNRARKDKLLGMIFSLNHVLLTKRLFIYDGGTVDRPYDHETEASASNYFSKKAKGDTPVLFADMDPFKDALAAQHNRGKYNEVLARVRWSTDGDTGLFIATNNLASRLLAQDRARLLLARLKQQALELGTELDNTYRIPIYFYAPNEPFHLSLYDEEAQHRDIDEANAIFQDRERRQTMEDNGDFEFLLFIPNLREQYADYPWRALAEKLKVHKQPAIAWSLLEKNEALYQDSASEPLIRVALMGAAASSNATVIMGIFSKKPELIQSATEFNQVLQGLSDPEQRTVVFNGLRNKLSTMIKSADDFNHVLQYLTPEQCAFVFKTKIHSIANLLKSSEDCKQVLQYLPLSERNTVFHCMLFRSLEGIRNNLGPALTYLTPEQCASICRPSWKETYQSGLRSRHEILSILKDLTPPQCTAVCQAMKDSLLSIIGSDLTNRGLDDNFFSSLTPAQCAAVCEAIKNYSYNSLREAAIYSIDNFQQFFLKDLTLEKCIVICDALKDTLSTMIKSSDGFISALKNLTSEQRTAVIKAMKETFPRIINTSDDLCLIFTSITQEQRTEVFNAIKDKLPTMLKSTHHFGWLKYLLPAQRTAFFDIMKTTLTTIIKSSEDFRRAYQSFFENNLYEEVFNSQGSAWLAIMKRWPKKERQIILKPLPPEIKNRVASLLPLMDSPSTMVLALALMDNNQEQIKTQIDILCQKNGHSLALLSHLDVFWIERLNAVLRLGLSAQDCADPLAIEKKLVTYTQSLMMPPATTKEAFVKRLEQYVQKNETLEKAHCGAEFTYFNFGLFKIWQYENRTASVLYVKEKLEQLKTQSIHAVFPSRKQALTDRKRLMAGRPFHDHGIRSQVLNKILEDIDVFIKTNPQAAQEIPDAMPGPAPQQMMAY